ncbi:hypothetical protein RYH80_06890 [Halobaculum sp. MBLA0147]|uniref:hypothetical protein n=1 Tax=Halobaculum sp. MBLA0147 TaxID=3079934 RepID=UPI00352654C3
MSGVVATLGRRFPTERRWLAVATVVAVTHLAGTLLPLAPSSPLGPLGTQSITLVVVPAVALLTGTVAITAVPGGILATALAAGGPSLATVPTLVAGTVAAWTTTATATRCLRRTRGHRRGTGRTVGGTGRTVGGRTVGGRWCLARRRRVVHPRCPR